MEDRLECQPAFSSFFPELCHKEIQPSQLIRIGPIDQLPITCLIKINGNKKSWEELTRYGMDFFNTWLNK